MQLISNLWEVTWDYINIPFLCKLFLLGFSIHFDMCLKSLLLWFLQTNNLSNSRIPSAFITCHFTVEFQAFFHIFHIQILCQICGFGIKSSLPLDLENWFSFRKLFEEKSFTVFYLYKSMIHFCWFLYKMWSRFVTFNCAYPVVPATFVGKAVFIELFLNLCQQTIEHICIIFLGSLFCSLSYVFIPLPRSQNGC